MTAIKPHPQIYKDKCMILNSFQVNRSKVKKGKWVGLGKYMTDPRLKNVLKYTVPVLNIVQPNIRVKGTYTFYKQLLK